MRDREEALYDSWDDGVAAILRDGAATSRLHRRLRAMIDAGIELAGFDLWASAALYAHGGRNNRSSK
jgi:hypothetical protein